MKQSNHSIILLGLAILILGLVSCSEDRSATQLPTGPTNDDLTVWQTALGGDNYDNGYAVLATSDGGYVVAGQTLSSGHGSWDAYLAKVDSEGELLWEQTYGGTGSDAASAIAATPDGGFVLAGSSNSTGAGRMDFYLIKTDANGVLQWENTFGADRDEIGKAVIVTSTGGYAITGSTQSFDALNYPSVYLVVTDADGNRIWASNYGGPAQETASGIVETEDGGFVLAGQTDAGPMTVSNAYVIRVDDRGEVVWTNTYGGTGNDFGRAIAKADDGYVIAGWVGSSSIPNHHGGYDIYGFKIDLDGNLKWQYGYGDAGYDGGETIAACADGGFVIGGHVGAFIGTGTPAQAYIVKINSSGQQEWESRMGQAGYRVASVSPASDGGFILGGSTSTPDGSDEDIMLIKTDATGRVTE